MPPPGGIKEVAKSAKKGLFPVFYPLLLLSTSLRVDKGQQLRVIDLIIVVGRSNPRQTVFVGFGHHTVGTESENMTE